jgi:hypothetical protein
MVKPLVDTLTWTWQGPQIKMGMCYLYNDNKLIQWHSLVTSWHGVSNNVEVLVELVALRRQEAAEQAMNTEHAHEQEWES